MSQARDKKDKANLALRVLQARALAKDACDCWEGCNDREGKLPCVHDILWEGVKLWTEKYHSLELARYP